MPESKTLFDTAFQTLQAQRAVRLVARAHPLASEAQARLNERLEDVKRAFPDRMEWQPKGTPAQTDAPCDLAAPPANAALITTCLTMQNANDLQGELAAIHATLAQGGLFLGVLLGGQSLHELRLCLMEAEIKLTGGAAPRVHPLPDMETISRLLTAVGFALPVVDHERVTLSYPDLYALMRDLRAQGCANALNERSRRFPPRALFNATQEIYAARFPALHGGLAVTADLVFLHGWKEDATGDASVLPEP